MLRILWRKIHLQLDLILFSVGFSFRGLCDSAFVSIYRNLEEQELYHKHEPISGFIGNIGSVVQVKTKNRC